MLSLETKQLQILSFELKIQTFCIFLGWNIEKSNHLNLYLHITNHQWIYLFLAFNISTCVLDTCCNETKNSVKYISFHGKLESH